MSKYPIWWNQTITLFNRYEDPVTNLVTWYSHVIDNCFWKHVYGKAMVDNIILETDSIVCRIPEQSNFLPRHEWAALSKELKAEHITLGRYDIIVFSAVSDEVNEYAEGHRSTDLLGKYSNLQGCMLVDEFAIDIGPGRVCPHYRVRGV